MQLIDGKKIAADLRTEITAEVKQIEIEIGRVPHLATLVVTSEGASEAYVAANERACQKVGMKHSTIRINADASEDELVKIIRKINNDTAIDGAIIQLPLPSHISESRIIETLDPKKDVDGMHPVNLGRLAANLPAFIPATPAGIIELLKRYKIETQGKKCVVIGRSNIVGMPISLLLARKATSGNATVTICHSRTADIASETKRADIVIVAMGKPNFLTAEMVKKGAVVIDVGTTRVRSTETKSGWRLVGDVDFEGVAPKCSFITPVPGGVGAITIVSLLKNTLLAAQGIIYQ